MAMLSYGINDKKCIFELQKEIGVSGKKMMGGELEVCNLIFLSVSKKLTKMGKFSYLHFPSERWGLKCP